MIPLSTKLYVEGDGEAIASDTGGAIKGNIIDLHFSDVSQCINWWRRQVAVTILS
ncbi:3D domain-containing protein [Enterococcus plantarum]|uniref:3D domain-containing protein n=1 Tax=Enterococcus plantarum TaxID=1077675 RepID=UPI0030FB59B9